MVLLDLPRLADCVPNFFLKNNTIRRSTVSLPFLWTLSSYLNVDAWVFNSAEYRHWKSWVPKSFLVPGQNSGENILHCHIGPYTTRQKISRSFSRLPICLESGRVTQKSTCRWQNMNWCMINLRKTSINFSAECEGSGPYWRLITYRSLNCLFAVS